MTPPNGAKNGRRAPLCGDYGGVGLDGQPCGHKAGTGRRGAKPGLCAMHNEVADANRQAAKKAFLEKLGTGTIAVKAAAEAVGKDQATIWKWRQTDLEFDALVRAAIEGSDKIRVSMVEDSLFARVVAGKASPAETIFFLVNRGGGRWRHIQTVRHEGGEDGKGLTVRVIREDAVAVSD
jgi:hypothetical protein